MNNLILQNRQAIRVDNFTEPVIAVSPSKIANLSI